MGTRSEQKKNTRNDLITAALLLSGQKGFSGLSLREVSVEAGITPAGFYKHFHGMEELGLAMLDEVGLSLRRLLREARRKVESGPDAVRISVETFLKFVNDNGNLFRLLLGERQGASLTFRKAIYAEMDRFVSELSLDLQIAQEARKKPLRNPAVTAEAIVAVVFTVGAEALELPPHKQTGLKDRLVEHVEIILRGSRVHTPTPTGPVKKRKS